MTVRMEVEYYYPTFKEWAKSGFTTTKRSVINERRYWTSNRRGVHTNAQFLVNGVGGQSGGSGGDDFIVFILLTSFSRGLRKYFSRLNVTIWELFYTGCLSTPRERIQAAPLAQKRISQQVVVKIRGEGDRNWFLNFALKKTSVSIWKTFGLLPKS